MVSYFCSTATRCSADTRFWKSNVSLKVFKHTHTHTHTKTTKKTTFDFFFFFLMLVYVLGERDRRGRAGGGKGCVPQTIKHSQKIKEVCSLCLCFSLSFSSNLISYMANESDSIILFFLTQTLFYTNQTRFLYPKLLLLFYIANLNFHFAFVELLLLKNKRNRRERDRKRKRW